MAIRTRYFQWLNGDNRGKITTLTNIFNEDGKDYFEFADGETMVVDYIAPMGTSISKIKDKLLVEIDTPDNPWLFKEITKKRVNLGQGQFADAPPLNDILKGDPKKDNFEIQDSDIGKLRLSEPEKPIRYNLPLPTSEMFKNNGAKTPATTITPKINDEPAQNNPVWPNNPDGTPVGYAHQEFREVEYQTKEPVVQKPTPVIPKTTVDETHPVSILVNKAKKHNQEIELTIQMMLPSKKIFDLAAEEFEDGADVFIDNIIKDLDMSAIVDSLKMALVEAYNGTEGDINYDVSDIEHSFDNYMEESKKFLIEQTNQQ